jgi:lantibiotic modifying enzyme
MSNDVLTGFAHGTSGIAYFLAVVADRFGNHAAGRAAERAADWLIAQGEPDVELGGHRWPYSRDQRECWQWWCHGAPGIALSFLKLYETTGDLRYADQARAALAYSPITVHSNLGQCHGLSGRGEIYLEAARVLGDPEYRQRAEAICETLMGLMHLNDGQCPTWLVEFEWRPVADLMTGCGGVVHFLANLHGPSGTTGFPLLA